MTRYQALIDRIQRDECILIDGATGTEMERRGVPLLTHAWNGGGALSHPEILLQVHRDYIALGAEVVITNTFATHYHALRDAGEDSRFEDYNRRAAEIAIDARRREDRDQVLVAGGMSYWCWSGNHPSLEDLGQWATRQARILTAAGVDLVLLEMMIDNQRMQVLLDAVRACDLPIWVGLTCEPNEDGLVCLRNGDPVTEALALLDQYGVDLLAVMHSEVRDIEACLEAIMPAWNKPVGVYAHSGRFENDHMVFDSTITADDYALAAEGWRRQGARLIGGCCGIQPKHIEVLAKRVTG